MNALEARIWRDDHAAGVLYALVGVGIGTAAGALSERTSSRSAAAALAAASAIGGRMLDRAARHVVEPLTRGDLVEARARLPWLVGRDPSELDEAEVARAVVESLAENTVDAVVAPAFWTALAGAPGALGYRAINTMDAMVGHRNARYGRFGTASARLDDVANWIPARITAGLVVLVRPRCARRVWRAVRRQAPGHPSPNSGVAEAAFAVALGVTLGGESRYGDRVEVRPLLGDGPSPSRSTVDEARRLALHVDAALAGLLGAVAAVGAWRRRGRA